MYADDAALLAESASNLQNMLNIFQDYTKRVSFEILLSRFRTSYYKLPIAIVGKI
jgi:hypothetical protein